MILRVTDKDEVRERHLDGVGITGTNILSQKYYDAFTGTESDYKPVTGKEIMCYLIVGNVGGVSTTGVFKIWAGTTINSKSGTRDVFGRTFTASNQAGGEITLAPFILNAAEYFTIERISGTGTSVNAEKIVGVERDVP